MQFELPTGPKGACTQAFISCPGMGQRANKKVKTGKPSVAKHQKWIKIDQINPWCLASGWNEPRFTQ